MEQLIIRGENLEIARNVIKAMPGYTVVKQILDESDAPQEHVAKPNTCSACPHFTRIEGARAERCMWGECSRHKANVGMYKPFCTSYMAEINTELVKED